MKSASGGLTWINAALRAADYKINVTLERTGVK